MDAEVKIGKLTLEHPIMNGAGCVRSREQVVKLVPVPVSAVVHGSTTKLSRLGNEGDILWLSDSGATLNSVGMGNPGLEAYADPNHLDYLAGLVDLVHQAGKPFIASIAGIELEDWPELVKVAMDAGVDAIEFNFGCPNVLRGDAQGFVFKEIPSFSAATMAEIFRRVRRVWGSPWPDIWIKLSPFSEPRKLGEAADVVAENKGMAPVVVSCNTFPSALGYREHGVTATTPANGLAGLGGKAMKHIALGQVYQLRQALPDDVAIIGVGGLSCGQDVRDMLEAGATAVQITSEYVAKGEDPRCFSRILSEYVDLV